MAGRHVRVRQRTERVAYRPGDPQRVAQAEGNSMTRQSVERLRQFIDEWKAKDGVSIPVVDVDEIINEVAGRTPYDTRVQVEQIRAGQPRPYADHERVYRVTFTTTKWDGTVEPGTAARMSVQSKE